MTDKISEITVFPIKSNGGVLAMASFVWDNSFKLGSIAIMHNSSGGYRLSYPSKVYKGRSISAYYPVDKAVALEVEHAIIKEYKEMINKGGRTVDFIYE